MPGRKPKPPADKAALLDAVRAAVKAAGGRRIRLKAFLGSGSGIAMSDIYAHFPSWNALLRAAGFHFDQHNQRIHDTALLADWAAVARKLQRPPTAGEYRRHGAYSLSAVTRRFRGWNPVREAFRAFAVAQPQWNDVLALLPQPGKESHPDRSSVPRRPTPSARPVHPSSLRLHPSPSSPSSFHSPYANGRPLCGEPLNLDAMLAAPVNESGVIFLFAILAPRLGFRVQSLQTAFPDCEARRLLWPGAWQTVRIEFEYESRNFRDHGHPAGGCDIIVCWKHNWTDCPDNLEVIELSGELGILEGRRDGVGNETI
jgi:hypothetical protein